MFCCFNKGYNHLFKKSLQIYKKTFVILFYCQIFGALILSDAI